MNYRLNFALKIIGYVMVRKITETHHYRKYYSFKIKCKIIKVREKLYNGLGK